MYITDIHLTDVRSFKGTHELSLKHVDGGYAGWTVFAGRNGAGKSTLLKAIALSAVGPLAARSLAGVFTDWVRHDEGVSASSVSTRLAIDPERDGFQTGGRTRKSPFWTSVAWSRNPHGPDILATGSDIPKKTADRGPWADTPRGWFIAGYGPYRHLGPAPAEVVKLSADPVVARLVNLFNESATLSEAVEWLKTVHLRALEEREGAEQLKVDVLSVLSDGLLPDGSWVRHVNSEGLWIDRDGVTMPLEQVSDGYRTVAALVVDLLRRLHDTYGSLGIQRDEGGRTRCDLPGVVLIDEVDAHMHVAWQQAIGFWLTSRFPRIQFLVTTHSPFICQAASEGGLIRLPAPGESDRIKPVSTEVWRRVVNGGADDAVLTELFGLPHAHSARVEQLQRELASLEARVLAQQATAAELDRYRGLKTEISDDLGTLADRKLRAVLGEGA